MRQGYGINVNVTEREAMKLTFEAIIECKSCDGTGLYVGMAEQDGSAVVCSSCKGTGRYKHMFTYTEFTQRKTRDDVKRVYATSAGYCHTPEDITTEEGKLIEFSKGGASYSDWLKGAELKPIKNLYCPLQFTGQAWKAQYCKDNWFGSIMSCPNRHNMEKCWKEWELSK